MNLHPLAWLMFASLIACSARPSSPAHRQVIAPTSEPEWFSTLEFPSSGTDGVVLSDGRVRLESDSVISFPFVPHPLTPGREVKLFGRFIGPSFNGDFSGLLEVRRLDGGLLLALSDQGWRGTEDFSVEEGRVTARWKDSCLYYRQRTARFSDLRTGDSVEVAPGETQPLGRWSIVVLAATTGRQRSEAPCVDGPSASSLRYVISENH